MKHLLTIPVALLACVTAACDTQGLFPLGAKRDNVVPCYGPTSTWLRTTPERTEVLLLGSADPVAAVPGESPQCFAWGYIEHDSSTHLEQGSYWLATDGTGQSLHNNEYDFNFDSTSAIINRKGAYPTRLLAPVIVPLRIQRVDADHVDVTRGSERHRYRSIYAVAEDLDPSTQAGADDMFRFVNIPLFLSQVRVNAFGSGRMTQYILAEPARFSGLIANTAIASEFTVQVASALNPHTTITYLQFRDVTGVNLSGEQRTLVNTSGTGPMEGILSFVVEGRPAANGTPNVLYRGTLAYDDIDIVNGVADRGSYGLDPDGLTGAAPSIAIDYTLAYDTDLRGLLPVMTP